MAVTNNLVTEVPNVFCQICGAEQAEDSQFCRKCGVRLAAIPTISANSDTHPEISSESNQQSVAALPLLPAPSAANEEKSNSSINFGTLVFASFSVLSLVVCLAKGITLIYLAEASVWAAAAIYWHRRSISSPLANLIVLLLAVCVAAGEGYSLGQSGSPNYTYLKEGNVQYRVDPHRGRTDRLSAVGWTLVSFDRPPEAIPFYLISRLVLSNGGLASATSASTGQICFDVQNNSDYVLKDVTILAAVYVSKPPSASPPPERVVLQSDLVGVERGTSAHLCGTTTLHLSSSDTWSYSDTTASGWKQ